MSPDSHGQKASIGASLRDARGRLGLDIKEAEERTKIRARYLRALEAEQWEGLPGPAYTRGFLRTYGQLLGLDGQYLADQYRRHHEPGAGTAAPASEPVLTERRRPGERPPSPGRWAGVVAGALVAVVAALVIFGGGEDDEPAGERGDGRAERQGQRGERGGGQRRRQGNRPRRVIDVEVRALSDVQLCLVGGSDSALIDTQFRAAGASEEFSGFRRYRLDVRRGSVRFIAGDERRRVEATDGVSLEADSRGIRETEYRGDECP
jgi:cytoskeleton protein RodZ